MPRSKRSLKAQTVLFKQLQRVGQVRVAEFMEVSEGTVSRLLNEELKNAPGGTTYVTRVLDLITGCGLRIVPEEMQCYRKESIASILQLAKERMEQLESPDQLLWGDEDE